MSCKLSEGQRSVSNCQLHFFAGPLDFTLMRVDCTCSNIRARTKERGQVDYRMYVLSKCALTQYAIAWFYITQNSLNFKNGNIGMANMHKKQRRQDRDGLVMMAR